MPKSDYVNVFMGSEAFDKSRLAGISKKWFCLKAQVGNTAPASRYPFGMVSCCGYSGGYPTGYGTYMPNYLGTPKQFIKELKLSGFTHFQLSGTGAIGKYYNFVKIAPFYNDINYLQGIKDEYGKVGYYSAHFVESNCKGECTVGKNYAYHKYTFDVGGTIAINLGASGLSPTFKEKFRLPVAVTDIKHKADYIECCICNEGVPIYCAIKVKGATITSIENNVAFCKVADKVAEFIVGFSFESIDNLSNVWDTVTSFEDTYNSNLMAWNNVLDKIEVDCTNKELFYTCLYNTFICPAFLNGESYLGGFTTTNYTTMWDLYKTQLPLVFSLFENMSTEIINTLIKTKDYFGFIPNGLMISTSGDLCSEQAKLLAVFSIYDAFLRDIKGVDWSNCFDVLIKEFNDGKYIDSLPHCEYPYHQLNISMAINCLHDMATKLNKADAINQLAPHINKEYSYLTNNGLLDGTAKYYEGGYKNYSFPIFNDMQKRINACGGNNNFVAELDKFFGYSGITPLQPHKYLCKLVEKMGLKLGRFEGYNNEPDMETPYNYIFAGRADKTYEIIKECVRLFSTDKNGIVGNEDSGAMSSCLVWNMLGVFPIGGQDRILLSTPLVTSASIKLSKNKVLHITNKCGNKPSANVLFNGNLITSRELTVTEFMQGGTLEFII